MLFSLAARNPEKYEPLLLDEIGAFNSRATAIALQIIHEMDKPQSDR